jgi:basic membrane protein A and related proteins
MMKKFSLLLAVVMVATLVLSACQPAAPAATAAPTAAPTQPPAPTATTAPTNTTAPEPTVAPTATTAPTATVAALPGAGKKVCQVTDTGGIDDKSFNATAWKGFTDAQTKLGVEAKYLESKQQTDYEKNINAFLEEKCDLIVTVGFLLGDATKAAAEKNPNQKFAIVDYAYDPTIPNVLGLTFATDQAAFLAGYLAAGVTKTGKVGTFGGLPIPTVTIFMDGFYAGVQYYNKENNTKVEVLGWDPKTKKGLFTNNFESTDDGRTMGETLMGEGADVIMPVAGPVGLGTAEAIKTAGNAWIIGVDTDWTVSTAQYKDIVLTSVAKNMDVAVFNATKSVLDGSFKGGIYSGTLTDGGVGLGTVAASVPADLIKKVEAVKADIISGKISVAP